MFVMMEMEIGRYLFVKIYVYRKFEKYVHSERKGGGLIYRERLLLYNVFFLLLKSEQAGGGGIKMGIFERRHFLIDPLIYYKWYALVRRRFFNNGFIQADPFFSFF